MKVLTVAGTLIEDRTPALDHWFTQQIDGLPGAIITELTVWYEIMKHASVELLRAGLMSDDPVRGALVALVAFHGLRAGQLQRLQLTDVRDGRLHVEGRVIVLAEPVRERLHAYLDMRQLRWPDTADPHLFLTRHTGRRTEECSKRWSWLTIGPDLSTAAIRADRILHEAHASGGDVRRLADLSIQAGTRYTNVISRPDFSGNDQF